MKDKISASLLAQYAYCPRAAWYRAHGIVPQGSGNGKSFKRGRRAHKFFGFFEKVRGLWSRAWRIALLSLMFGGVIFWLYQMSK